ncbi:MAG: TetR/AcrR family transcriptional regulator [Halioglobus sp.]
MTAKSPGRPRSERAQNAILASAYELLEEGGLTKVTMEAVATRAKVGKPTIYRYWINAQELAMAAVMARTEPPVEETLSQSPLKNLKDQLQRVVERFASPTGRQTAILMASADTDSELSKAFRNQVILKSREQGRAILERAAKESLIPIDLPIETVLDMIYGPIFYRLLTGHAPLHDTFANEIVDALFSNTIK